MSENTEKLLRDHGFHEEADMIAGVTPEDEARFDEWLSDPVNRERWEAALAEAREGVSGV